jgi:hypothetical protein
MILVKCLCFEKLLAKYLICRECEALESREFCGEEENTRKDLLGISC